MGGNTAISLELTVKVAGSGGRGGGGGLTGHSDTVGHHSDKGEWGVQRGGALLHEWPVEMEKCPLGPQNMTMFGKKVFATLVGQGS